jgi:F-type H+-transporting ATPase subunit b
MSIEWSQVLTHLVGFLVALFILKAYAWKPILKVLDDRREKIAAEFADIEEQKQKTDQLFAEYEDRLRKIEDEARRRIQEAVSEGQQMAGEIKLHAQEEARRITARAQADIERELDKARVLLKQEMVGLTLGATERLLREKLDPAAHRQMVERFLGEVESAA